MKTHPHEPKDGMTVEKVSLAVSAVFGVVGLAYFIATTLEVFQSVLSVARLAHTRRWLTSSDAGVCRIGVLRWVPLKSAQSSGP
jgi:hypothetical protein